MSTIYVTQSKSTELTSGWNNIRLIEIESKPFSEGAFGEIYDCKAVNGSVPAIDLVVKVFKQDGQGNDQQGYKTICRMQERIIKKNHELSQTGKSLVKVPGLYALPQFSFAGQLNNKQILGYAAHKLNSQLFDSFDSILQTRYPEFCRLDLNRKLQLCLDLVECFDILRDLNYIHADINPHNLFISLKDGHLVVIDYDSGVVVDNLNDTPTTFGKMDEWLAPEIVKQLMASPSGQQKVRVNLFTDLWSIGVGIHYFLFDVFPYFFLNDGGAKDLEDYLGKYQWPEVDNNYANFDKRASNQYKFYRGKFDKSNIRLKKPFEANFVNGVLDPSRRTSYQQWIQVLKPLVNPIPFEAFTYQSPTRQITPSQGSAHTISQASPIQSKAQAPALAILKKKLLSSNNIFMVLAIVTLGAIFLSSTEKEELKNIAQEKPKLFSLIGNAVKKDSSGDLLIRQPVAYRARFAEAREICQNLNHLGYSDWKLPSDSELAIFREAPDNLNMSARDFFGGSDICYSHRSMAVFWLDNTDKNGWGSHMTCPSGPSKYVPPGFVAAVICFRYGSPDNVVEKKKRTLEIESSQRAHTSQENMSLESKEGFVKNQGSEDKTKSSSGDKHYEDPVFNVQPHEKKRMLEIESSQREHTSQENMSLESKEGFVKNQGSEGKTKSFSGDKHYEDPVFNVQPHDKNTITNESEELKFDGKRIQPQTNYWHYCRNPEGYYPYVKQCPDGWIKVTPSQHKENTVMKSNRSEVVCILPNGIEQELSLRECRERNGIILE